MDGWMDGIMGGWIDGLINGWMGGHTDGDYSNSVEIVSIIE